MSLEKSAGIDIFDLANLQSILNPFNGPRREE
jgi:hypothetical protein